MCRGSGPLPWLLNYVGFPAKKDHYRYHKYACTRWKKRYERRAMELDCPRVSGNWLEGIVWADVKRFLSDPGAALERVREQMGSDDERLQLEARHADLSKRLAAKSAEKDRYVRAFAQGHISEEELAEYVTDLKTQIDTLKLLIASVESDLAAREHDRLTAESAEAWLLTLRERVSEIEEDTDEAFAKRRELVKLLVERIDVDRDENGHTRAEITYRFAPPGEAVICRYQGIKASQHAPAYASACQLVSQVEQFAALRHGAKPLPIKPSRIALPFCSCPAAS